MGPFCDMRGVGKRSFAFPTRSGRVQTVSTAASSAEFGRGNAMYDRSSLTAGVITFRDRTPAGPRACADRTLQPQAARAATQCKQSLDRPDVVVCFHCMLTSSLGQE